MSGHRRRFQAITRRGRTGTISREARNRQRMEERLENQHANSTPDGDCPQCGCSEYSSMIYCPECGEENPHS